MVIKLFFLLLFCLVSIIQTESEVRLGDFQQISKIALSVTAQHRRGGGVFWLGLGLRRGGGDVIVIFRDQRPSWITSSEAYYFFVKQVKSSSILSSYIKTTQPHTQDFSVVVCPFFSLIFMLYY